LAIEKIERVSGTAIPLRGDNVDTDRIIPARFLKSITFEGQRHATADPKYDGASVLLVNANFGCGSSREHAPQAIRRRGIRVIVGQSFSEIFFGNSVALGLPCVAADQATLETLMSLVEKDPSQNVEVDLAAMTVSAGGRTFPVTLPPGAQESFLEGSWDATGLLLDRFEEVEATAARLPYMRWA
jgi:3-isopropylmalate/(R)-2-methylmalate dehydratase small subunit